MSAKETMLAALGLLLAASVALGLTGACYSYENNMRDREARLCQQAIAAGEPLLCSKAWTR